MVHGKVRVGRRIYSNNFPKGFRDPSIEGYTNVLCLTPSSPYGELSPYVLKVDVISSDQTTVITSNMENAYQFSKVYQKIPKSRQTYSRYDRSVIWNHPAEVHVNEEGELTEEYWAWRDKGMKCEHAIRYPVGFSSRHSCLYSVPSDDIEAKLGYVDSRKQIYLKYYLEAVVKEKKFLVLKKRLAKGESLLIIEVDGPHQESLEYYKKTYGVSDKFVVDSTMLATRKNLKIMLNDEKHPFGHGYVLAAALLDLGEELMES